MYEVDRDEEAVGIATDVEDLHDVLMVKPAEVQGLLDEQALGGTRELLERLDHDVTLEAAETAASREVELAAIALRERLDDLVSADLHALGILRRRGSTCPPYIRSKPSVEPLEQRRA
jgi:hypothetical protein